MLERMRTERVRHWAFVVMWTMVIAAGVTAAVVLLGGCGERVAPPTPTPTPTPEQIARDVAIEWTRTSVDEVAEYAAERVAGEIPVVRQLAGGWLRGQIDERIEWAYGDPRCDPRCDVTVTASADVDVNIPFVMTDTVTVSVPFVLRIDTDERRVLDWNPNALGTRVQREDGS